MIIYFSGSGNSLAIARQLAEGLGEQLVPLYSAVKQDLTSEKRIGFVFPTYDLDAPKAVKTLVPRLQLPKDAYTFVVITCGAQTNNAVWTLRKLLSEKGIDIQYSHKIRVPDSSAVAFGRNPNDQKWKFEKYANRTRKILSDIKQNKQRLHFAGFDPVGWLFQKTSLAEKMEKSLQPQTNIERCVGCGICSKVCPQSNITIVDKTACLGDSCTMCLACLHFCPQQAMQFAGKTIPKEMQYHHPAIKAKDMMRKG